MSSDFENTKLGVRVTDWDRRTAASSWKSCRRATMGIPGRLKVPLLAVCVWGCMLAPDLRAALQQDGAVEPPRSARVTRITSEIAIDGLLDESVWTSSPTIGDLIQRQPLTGESPTERTVVTLLHDGDSLYIGVMCYDSEPDQIVGNEMGRDASMRFEDQISIVLDTYRDQRNAFFFATNPAGALVDGLVFANGQSNNDWDTIWTVRTRRTDEGWSAEFEIPFKSLTFPVNETVWGFNISRIIGRKLEEDRWSGAILQTQFLNVSEAGEITNLEGLTQGIGLNIRPFVSGRRFHRAAREGTVADNIYTGKPGLDMFYNLTPSLKLTATVNTDFGETEVDARQINLGRFRLLFPEKRSFFLEDAGVFNVAGSSMRAPAGIPGTGADLFPFFSRRIGLLQSGAEVPLDFGVKLTGRAGRSEIGVLNVRTRDITAPPEKNLFVGRFKQNLMEQSHIGVIFTDGNPELPIASQTFGGDIRLATSRFLGTAQNLDFNAYAVKSQNEGTSDRDWSYGIAMQYPNDLFHAQFILRDVQENFDPALGFVQRRNVRMLRVGASYNPRPRDFLDVQQMIHDIYYTRFSRLDTGELETEELTIQLVDWHFNSGDNLHALVDVNPTFERLFEPFEIFPGVVLAPGDYRYTRFRYNLGSAQRRRVQATVMGFFGPYWSGRAAQVQTGLTFRIPPYFSIRLNSNQTFARLPEGNFVARVITSQINYAASPFLSFSNLIQYDNRSRNLGWQSRVRWIMQPGNDFFFVFNQGWIQDPEGGYRFTAQDSRVSAKLQYTVRF